MTMSILEWLLQKIGLNWIQVSLSGSSRRGTAVHSKKSFSSTAEGGRENISWTGKQLQASYDRPDHTAFVHLKFWSLDFIKIT